MVNIAFRGLQVKKPVIKKCTCGKCGNLLLIVKFDKTAISFGDGLEWVPSMNDIEVIAETLNNVYEHNKKHDKYCYIAGGENKKTTNEPAQ